MCGNEIKKGFQLSLLTYATTVIATTLKLDQSVNFLLFDIIFLQTRISSDRNSIESHSSSNRGSREKYKILLLYCTPTESMLLTISLISSFIYSQFRWNTFSVTFVIIIHIYTPSFFAMMFWPPPHCMHAFFIYGSKCSILQDVDKT